MINMIRRYTPYTIYRTQAEYDGFLARVKEWHDDLARELPGRITDTTLFRRSLVDEVGGENESTHTRTHFM